MARHQKLSGSFSQRVLLPRALLFTLGLAALVSGCPAARIPAQVARTKRANGLRPLASASSVRPRLWRLHRTRRLFGGARFCSLDWAGAATRIQPGATEARADLQAGRPLFATEPRHRAHAVLQHPCTALINHPWLTQLLARRPFKGGGSGTRQQKMARIIWALLARRQASDQVAAFKGRILGCTRALR